MTERIRAARCLDSSMVLACPKCSVNNTFVVNWRGVPAKNDNKDHQVQAANAYIQHIKDEHGIPVERLKVSDLPVALDHLRQDVMEEAVEAMVENIMAKLTSPGSPLMRGLDGDARVKHAALRELKTQIVAGTDSFVVSCSFGFWFSP